MSWYEDQFRLLNHKLDWLIQATQYLIKQEKLMAHTLDEVLAGVAEESSKEDSLILLVANIKKALEDALLGGLSPAQQAKVDAVFDAVTSNSAKVQAVLDANTPASPPPVVEPTP